MAKLYLITAEMRDGICKHMSGLRWHDAHPIIDAMQNLPEAPASVAKAMAKAHAPVRAAEARVQATPAA